MEDLLVNPPEGLRSGDDDELLNYIDFFVRIWILCDIRPNYVVCRSKFNVSMSCCRTRTIQVVLYFR